jgi:hypothetical protein
LQRLIIFSLVAFFGLGTLAHACLGGSYAVKDGKNDIGGLYGSSFALKKSLTTWEKLNPPSNTMINSEIYKSKTLSIKIIYVEAAQDTKEVVSTFYSIVENGKKAKTIQVKTNVFLDDDGNEDGRTRSLTQTPIANEVWGCGGRTGGEGASGEASH